MDFAVSYLTPNFATMSAPAISILLPAYNCSRYIGQTIDSLLNQTFTNFELLIINDGSSDNTEQVIQSYSDPRINYLKNDSNKGLVYTLNRGIQEAKGNYIARMDADDIALPTRLQLQKQWLDEHPNTAAVSCTITFIDDKGNQQGDWKEDKATCTYADIVKTLPKANCIAHPTIMIRKGIALAYLYDPMQVHCEDYDLWLRMLADGLIIEKLPEPLLLYRNHTESITGTHLKRLNPFYKQFRCKRRFLAKRAQQRKWGIFESQVLLATVYDGLAGMGKQLKNKLTF